MLQFTTIISKIGTTIYERMSCWFLLTDAAPQPLGLPLDSYLVLHETPESISNFETTPRVRARFSVGLALHRTYWTM